MRRVSPCLPGRDRPRPPPAGLLQQAASLAMQPAGPALAARKASALGTELLLPPYWNCGCNVPSCGQDHAVFWERSMKFDSAIHTSKSSTKPHQSSPRATKAADASVVDQRPGHTRDSATETPETPGPKGRPSKAQRPPEPPRGCPNTTRSRHVLPPPRRRVRVINKRQSHPAQHK